MTHVSSVIAGPLRMLLPAVVLILVGCATGQSEKNAADPANPVGVYVGQSPSASSPGIVRTLVLYPQGELRLESDYLNNEAPIVESGQWQQGSDGQIELVLSARIWGANGDTGDPVSYDDPTAMRMRLEGRRLSATDYPVDEYGEAGLELRRSRPDPAPLLPGSSWQLQALVMPNGERVQPDNPGQYSLNLTRDNQLNGQADCNSFRGGFAGVDTRLHISPLAATRAACPAGSVSDRFLQILQEVDRIAVHEDGLQFFTAARGSLIMTRRE